MCAFLSPVKINGLFGKIEANIGLLDNRDLFTPQILRIN